MGGSRSKTAIEAQGELRIAKFALTDQVVSIWYETVRACGVSVRDAETIRPAFIYPGFPRKRE
jgi:hypothetical protein